MDLWSKGLGRRVLSMTLGERERLAAVGDCMVIEGTMHAPTYWEYQVSLDEDDIVEFLELLNQPDSLRFLAANTERRRIVTTAATSALVFAGRTLRLAVTGAPGGPRQPAPEITLRRVVAKSPADDDWTDAVVDWDREESTATPIAGDSSGADPKGDDDHAGA